MNKIKQKKFMALFLAASMSIPTIAFGADINEFKDFPNDWSKTALTYAVKNGLLSGDNGVIRAKDNLTRAELAAIINRTLSNTKEASLSQYTDVPKDAWYYKDMAKAVQSGLFVGDGDKLNPNKPVTREEVFAVLARCFSLENSNQYVINAFDDKDSISNWAKEATASMVSSGYVKGDGNRLNPKANITRAEFSQIVYSMAGNFANQGETLSNNVKGNLMIRGTNSKLNNMKIEGDLILADGADNVTLDNVEVTGKILLRGGLENVTMTNIKATNGMKVALPSGTANILATKCAINDVTLQSNAVLSGDWSNITVSNTSNIVLKNGTVNNVTISENAKETVIDVQQNSKVSNIKSNASKSVIKGEGKVENVTSNNNDISVLTKSTIVNSQKSTTDLKQTDKKETKTDSKKTDNKKTDSKKTDSKKTDSKKTDSKKTNIKKTDNKKNKKQSSNNRNKDRNKDKSKNKGLADGTWYGTGTWSRYYNTEGPNVVKVVIDKGVIKTVESVKFADDAKYKNTGIRVLKFLEGVSDTSNISSQLDKKSGAAYDAVSHATETAKGYVSAVQNALDRSKQYSKDNVKQEIGWIEFTQKPKETINYGEKLDLSTIKLKLHMVNGSEKEISYNEFAKNNITVNYENGITINKGTKGIKDNTLDIYLKNEASKLTLPTRIAVLDKTTFKTPTYILVTYKGGETQKIELNDNKFVYSLSPTKIIEKMEIFDKDKKISDGQFDTGRNEWCFNLSKVLVDEGYTDWKYKDYYVELDTTSDVSEITDFKLDTSNLKLNYAFGETLNLNKLKISATTKNGNPQVFNNLSEAIVRGFKIDPVSGYELKSSDAGEKQITVSYGDVSKTFNVNVKDYTNNVPEKVELYDSSNDKLIKTIEVNKSDWQRNKGCLMIRDIEIPETYKNWTTSTFKLKLYNESNHLIESEQYNTDKTDAGFIYEIDFPKYNKYYSDGGYLKLVFKYKAGTTEPSVTPSPEEKTEKEVKASVNIGQFKGDKTIMSPDYDVKVSVTYDTKTGKIISVKDDGTDAGSGNKSFWDSAKSIFENLKGKTKSNVDTVDGVTSATVSSDAIKAAVKKALGEEKSTEKEEKTEKEVAISVNIADYKGKNSVAPPDYDVKLNVTYNTKTGEIISVKDNGTEAGEGNKSFWDNAKNIFNNLKGKTKSNIDSVDGITSATVSSDAIKAAVKKALEQNSESTESLVTVSQPSLSAEDMRSSLTFASNTNAVFTVSRPNGADIFYTLDGSNPISENLKKN